MSWWIIGTNTANFSPWRLNWATKLSSEVEKATRVNSTFFFFFRNYVTRMLNYNALHSASGLVGCMREIQVNDERIEPRHVINTDRVIGEVALDNCQFVDPCTRPNTCEHQGKCSVTEDRITCDCTGTGYIGKNCHFSKQICRFVRNIRNNVKNCIFN